MGKLKINYKFYLSITLLFLATANSSAWGFATYSNESNWQSAAGSTVLEDFQGYLAGTQISSLPDLGVGFDVLAGGGYPATYLHHENDTPYGTMHLGNFPNGINETNRWDDISLYVLPGYEITALGYWNGDGQADTFVARVYDASDTLLGTVGAFKGNFAGFITDAPIARVVFDGHTGDGWNHLDGLQTNAVLIESVPEPATLALMGFGLAGLGFSRRKRSV
jgi:hypothetical protein